MTRSRFWKTSPSLLKSTFRRSRRDFLQQATLGTILPAFVAGNISIASPNSTSENSTSENSASDDRTPSLRTFCRSFSLDENQATFYLPRSTRPTKIMIVSDSHLFRDDERGEPFREYSGRMSKAYNETTHWRTGLATTPEQAFEETLKIAQAQNVDCLALLGDMLSFPSEAGRDWLLAKLTASGVPFRYISGNHDWHYEGFPGSSKELRDEWTAKRLTPLYQGESPLASSVELDGVRLVFIDDSINEILPEQLEFFRRELAIGQPTVLLAHIPPFAPGRSVGYSIGHPDWNAKTDGNYEIERRPRWPEEGHNETTLAFYRETLAAPNLIGSFSGHIHRQTLDVVAGKPLLTVGANAVGAYAIVQFLPIS